MVIVMYGIVLLIVLVSVALAAIKDTHLADAAANTKVK